MKSARSTPGLRLAASVMLATAVLAGCATPPASTPRTTVVLLPDEDGNVGAVSVSGASGSQTLDQAFSAAAVGGANPTAANVRTLGQDSVDAAYADLLKAQPTQPRTFILYFKFDKTELTAESKALLPTVLATAHARKPTEITVFGHADATGKAEHNWKLSAERAKVVADLLRASDPEVGPIDVQYFGHKVPLVSSGARGAEPKNRRAEIMIL